MAWPAPFVPRPALPYHIPRPSLSGTPTHAKRTSPSRSRRPRRTPPSGSLILTAALAALAAGAQPAHSKAIGVERRKRAEEEKILLAAACESQSVPDFLCPSLIAYAAPARIVASEPTSAFSSSVSSSPAQSPSETSAAAAESSSTPVASTTSAAAESTRVRIQRRATTTATATTTAASGSSLSFSKSLSHHTPACTAPSTRRRRRTLPKQIREQTFVEGFSFDHDHDDERVASGATRSSSTAVAAVSKSGGSAVTLYNSIFSSSQRQQQRRKQQLGRDSNPNYYHPRDVDTNSEGERSTAANYDNNGGKKDDGLDDVAAAADNDTDADVWSDTDADGDSLVDLYTSRTIPDRYELGTDGLWHKVCGWSSCTSCTGEVSTTFSSSVYPSRAHPQSSFLTG